MTRWRTRTLVRAEQKNADAVCKTVGYFRFDRQAEQEALAEVYRYRCPLYNVPAVYDIFAVAIKECKAFLYRNRKNVGGVWRGNGA